MENGSLLIEAKSQKVAIFVNFRLASLAIFTKSCYICENGVSRKCGKVHKSIYFASGWANYSAARKGSLRLSPPMRILEELEKDYALMAPMFFREIPRWEQILKALEDFEREFNT